MIKITELKEGDIVKVLNAGEEKLGTVVGISREENMAHINNGVQDFWYSPEDIVPIPLTEEQLIHTFGFEKEETAEGMKYKKGPFRLVIHDPGNSTNLDLWHREDRRHFNHPLYVHELQNLYYDMTKVYLEGVLTH